LLLHCTPPLTLTQGICYQALQPATDWQQAHANCLNLRMRMPGVSETEAVLANEFFNGTLTADEEDWTDNDSGVGLATTVRLSTGGIISWGRTFRRVTSTHTAA
jgi:hypothetical protein